MTWVRVWGFGQEDLGQGLGFRSGRLLYAQDVGAPPNRGLSALRLT
jgi:hypothetical protein